jgi:hypothetical protein
VGVSLGDLGLYPGPGNDVRHPTGAKWALPIPKERETCSIFITLDSEQEESTTNLPLNAVSLQLVLVLCLRQCAPQVYFGPGDNDQRWCP